MDRQQSSDRLSDRSSGQWMVTVPAEPSTVMVDPSGMMSVAPVTLTTHGIPNSRLTMIA
ncbi:MAG: hypothetical protein ABJ381_01360 [Ilumatobacter sp.]|uniref:hypothetical protein n=1 Tax=Ilumatobacter sp. TaxID=1967498 RepID=UPI003299C96C